MINFSVIVRVKPLTKNDSEYSYICNGRNAVIDTLNNNRCADKTYTQEEQKNIRNAFGSVITDYKAPTRKERGGNSDKGVLPFYVGKTAYLCTGDDKAKFLKAGKKFIKNEAPKEEKEAYCKDIVNKAKKNKTMGSLLYDNIGGSDKINYFEIGYPSHSEEGKTEYLREIILL